MPYRRTLRLLTTPENPQLNWGDSVNKGLVAYYPCNEPGGLKVRCAVNPAQNLTLSSGYTSRLNGPGGAHGRGLKFTNATQIASGALVKAVTGGPCTIACWITIDTMPTLSSIMVALGGAATADVEYITYIYNNNLCWGHSSDDLQPTISAISAGQRVFVVGSTNSAKLQSLYRNGWLAGTRTATALPTVSSTVTLGGQYNANTGNNFTGSIDNVRIYNRALSQSEVTRLYQEPFAGVVYPRRRTISAVASVGGVTGTAAATLANPTASFTGTVGVTGTLAATLAKPTAAITGKVGVRGTLAATLDKPTASVAGKAGATGTLSATLAKPTAAITGRVGVRGTLAATLAKPTASASGVANVVRTFNLATGAFTQTGNAGTFVRARKMAAAAGSYTEVPGTTLLTASRKLTLATRAFTITPSTTLLSRRFTLVGNKGSVITSGNAANIAARRVIQALQGSYTQVPSPVYLWKSSFIVGDSEFIYVPWGENVLILDPENRILIVPQSSTLLGELFEDRVMQVSSRKRVQ